MKYLSSETLRAFAVLLAALEGGSEGSGEHGLAGMEVSRTLCRKRLPRVIEKCMCICRARDELAD